MAGRRRNVSLGANSIVYSGRGRPRTKETVDRPLPVGIVLGSPSPGGDLFKDRKIRVGGAFQAKVPKQPLILEEKEEGQHGIPYTAAYRSSRPPPSRVSTVHPHLTQEQVKDYERQEMLRQDQKEGDSLKQQTEEPSAMEIDTSLSQITTTTATEGASTGITTISPDSSTSLLSTSEYPKKATVRQQQQQQELHSDTNSNSNSSENPTEIGQGKNDEGEDCLETQRGGLLLYPSTTDHTNDSNQQEDDFWDFVQPLMAAATSTSSQGGGSNHCVLSWQEHIHKWYVDQREKQQQAEKQRQEELELQLQQEQLMPRRRGRRKRRKEPAAAVEIEQEDIMEWYDEQRAPKRPRTEGTQEEDRAHAMQHLCLRHKGHGSMAKLETMVQLSAGKANMARRIHQHKRRKARPNNTTDTLPWREYCEGSIIKSMTGDFRQTSDPTENDNKSTTQLTFLDRSDIDRHQEIWKSVLKFGQSIEEKLTKAASSNKRNLQPTKLSTITSFLNNVYHVRPLPKDIFRASDIPPTIDSCCDNIASYADQARQVQAQLMDLLHETNGDGVDLDALNKLLDQSRRSLAVELDDAKVLHEQLESWLDWQKRLEGMVGESELCLSSLEDLAKEGQSFTFRAKSLVCLEHRIERAYQLRDKIVEWKKACTQDDADDFDDKKECVKFLNGMVRDANRLKLSFPEVADLRETHRSVEAWIDRANIAIRSRISLTEIKTLIERGQNMPVDLADSMEKLRARESLAEEWIQQFEEVVPRPKPPPTEPSIESDDMLLRWMREMRGALLNGKYAVLHDVASEGSRIPVEVDLVKLLQLELDAKNWTTKGKKWTPRSSGEENTSCKKGKLEDLREHMGKAAVLRERLDLSATAKEAWTLDGEQEIRSIVQAADDWFAQYKPYLDWDNRRSLGRSCLSLYKLRTIVNEGNAIHANIGSAIGKMTRILAEAEGWMNYNEPLLLTCKIIPQEGSTVQPLDKRLVTLQKMTEVAEAAASDVSLDLDEAKALLELVEKVKDWTSRVANAAPKRSVRGRGRKSRFTVDDIISLVKEASNIPVDTTDDVNRLQIQLSGVQEWRANAREKLEEISNGFQKLQHVVDDMYGAPNEYSRGKDEKADASDEKQSDAKSELESSEEKKVTEDSSLCETASNAGSEQDGEGIPNFGNGTCNVNQLIKVYRREAKAFGVVSGEVEAAELLDKVSNWCVRSLKYLVTQRDVFDKRFFRAFDRFVADGRELLNPPKVEGMDVKIKLDDEAFSEKLNGSWSAFVSDQVQRLEVLVADREQFISWCNVAETELFSGDNRPSLEKLRDISDRSRSFPAVCDMVQKVRGLFNKAMEWKEATSKLLNGHEKMAPLDAKNMLEVGEKLGFSCEEMKVLRNALRAARNWSNRVKKSKIDQGAADAAAIQVLIDDHDKLLLAAPEEVDRLKQAMQSYCLCRRPYSGFMIGCDECEEWYHGPCIGITESKADRFDKYVCIRCSLSRVFNNTAKDAVGIVRKWTCAKDMKKARQVEAQKHQRKVRKETKDIEKLRAEIQSLEASQEEPTQEETINESIAQDAPPSLTTNTPPENATVAPANSEETQKPAESEAPKKTSSPKLSPEDAKARIEKAHETIRQCNERLSSLSEKGEERKAILCMEDSKAPLLRNWCLRVRSVVLVPRSEERAEESRPMEDGTLSTSMQGLIDEAHEAGIASVNDVEAMINAFRSMSWCILATKILARKPTMAEMELLVAQAKRLKLAEEKALRMIKAIVLRAKSWSGKVLKALSPFPGEPKTFNVDALKELEASSDDIPVLIKEEALLSGVIEDEGARHCVCGGPTDARVMLSCDKCEKWFHGPCMNMTKGQCDAVAKWICPPCKGSATSVDVANCGIVWEERDDARQTKKRLVAPEAPDAAKMWPPFGLFASEKAQEALGTDCGAIPDVASTIVQSKAAPTAAPDPQPETITNGTCGAMMVPPTTLVQSADVSQELFSQGIQPSNCGLLADTDSDAQAQFAASTLKTSLELSQQQAFRWLAQSGAAAALAATQVNLAQSQPQAFGWQHNPFLSVAATAAAAASISNQTLHNPASNNGNSESSRSGATEVQNPLSALETLAQMANNPQVLSQAAAASAEVTSEEQKPKALAVEPSASSEIEATSDDKAGKKNCTTDQFLSTVPSAASTVTTEQSQSQVPSASPQLNPTSLNLLVAALPVQDSGS